MLNYLVQEQKASPSETFAAAEQALSEAGIGFTVVEEYESQVSDPPLAA